MQFDLFHSIGRIDSVVPRLTDRQVFANFFEQTTLAEKLGYGTIWVAESHFSSEVQKSHARPVIPHYEGEVGLNCDTPLLCQQVFQRTERIGFGTAIFNIVGGNGGPIGAADRIRSLAWHNAMQDTPRRLDIGVASGRFPYINAPYGIVPRSDDETKLWGVYRRLIFVEALEIFLRLSRGETLSDSSLVHPQIGPDLMPNHDAWAQTGLSEPIPYEPRWRFEPLKLVPELPVSEWCSFMNIVLGSSDPLARKRGFQHHDLDIFNLSFTAPDKINALHRELEEECRESTRAWHRSRLPRTVLVFIDDDHDTALARAHRCFDTYIEAMRGTVGLPPKDVLMARALIGDPQQIKEQLSPDDPHGFHQDDRLMLWFEFNQSDGADICRQMTQFSEHVMPDYA